ncbi:MAG: S41 family peptidase [Bacteroidota bacterium]|nr:S41 family peptidase [Bacteroidota bacterium]
MRTCTRFDVGHRRLPFFPFALLWILTAGFVFHGDDSEAFQRGSALLSRLFMEIGNNYMIPVDADELLKAGIKGMLSSLDPYSTFVDVQDRTDVEMLTSGSYGGLGVTVSNRGGRLIVTDFIEDIPPSPDGLRIGDQILRIDTLTITRDVTDVRQYLRGQPGTEVHLLVRRPGTDEPVSLTLVRKHVPVRTVSIVDTIAPGILYMKIDRFTRFTAPTMKPHLERFLASVEPRGIILDLRDNPGGLLESAVEVLEFFLPHQALLVSTLGRKGDLQNERTYLSRSNPVCPDLPLVILVNNSSASASEIVAGAVQDHDRGIVIGSPTFGKGLVQSIIPVDPQRSIKLTTSKYYTPSGRCIQKPFPLHGVHSARVEGDTTFRTLRFKRTLHGGGGILPDVQVFPDSGSNYSRKLHGKGVFTLFTAWYIAKEGKSTTFPTDRKLRSLFSVFVDTMREINETETEYHTGQLLSAMRREHYAENVIRQAETLERTLRTSRPDRVTESWDDIRRELETEFAFQTGGRIKRFQILREHDEAIGHAVRLLNRKTDYLRALQQHH